MAGLEGQIEGLGMEVARAREEAKKQRRASQNDLEIEDIRVRIEEVAANSVERKDWLDFKSKVSAELINHSIKEEVDDSLEQFKETIRNRL